MKPTVVSFYTLNDPYPWMAARLEASCKKQGLDYLIVEIKPEVTWVRTVALKASHILRMARTLERPVLWVDADGETHELIYDVACSDDRRIRDRRCERPVGSTVDIEDASYTNTIGDPLLTAFWEDPDFDPNLRAFYYVRVIEIPKPRWTAYDAKFFGIEMPEEVTMTVQDRAYTSPIWYMP